MNNSYKIIYLITCSIFLACLSCRKLIEIPPPTDRVVKSVVFTNDATALSAISGLYSQMTRTGLLFSSGAMTVYAGLTSDELSYTSTSGDIKEFNANTISASNNLLLSNIWGTAYNLVYGANNIIEGLENSSGVSLSVKNQLLGEARFIRAFCNFYLVNLFGGVPIVTTTDFRINSNLSRNTESEVYVQILSDLDQAKSLLSVSYPSAGRARPNSLTASALLARVYLFMGEWMNAEREAGIVINSGTYSLVPVLNNVFLSNSNESIWNLISPGTTNTYEGNIFIPAASTIPVYIISQSFVSAFETGDQRKTAWIKSVTVGSNTYSYPFKYKVKTATTVTEYPVVFRLAEQFLIRAEARAHLNNLAGAVADLNMIRTRASLPVTTANSISSILLEAEQQRKSELFAEWGHRWLDLKRTGRADLVLSPLKTGWQTWAVLFPIPFKEILLNTNLIQNPGYQ